MCKLFAYVRFKQKLLWRHSKLCKLTYKVHLSKSAENLVPCVLSIANWCIASAYDILEIRERKILSSKSKRGRASIDFFFLFLMLAYWCWFKTVSEASKIDYFFICCIYTDGITSCWDFFPVKSLAIFINSKNMQTLLWKVSWQKPAFQCICLMKLLREWLSWKCKALWVA